MNKDIIQLKPTLARKRRMMINDVLPGVILLINGISELIEPSEHGNYAILNIIVGAAVIIAFRFELKHHSASEHKTIKWFDVIAGIVLMVEAGNRYHADKIFQPALFYFLIGTVGILRGVFQDQFPTFRKLACDDTGFILRLNPFRKYEMRWKEIAAIDMVDNTLQIKAVGDKLYNIPLQRVENRNEIFETIRKYLHN